MLLKHDLKEGWSLLTLAEASRFISVLNLKQSKGLQGSMNREGEGCVFVGEPESGCLISAPVFPQHAAKDLVLFAAESDKHEL